MTRNEQRYRKPPLPWWERYKPNDWVVLAGLAMMVFATMI